MKTRRAAMRNGWNTVTKRYVDEISKDEIDIKLPVPKKANQHSKFCKELISEKRKMMKQFID